MRTIITLALVSAVLGGSIGLAEAAGLQEGSNPARARPIKEILMARGGTCKTVSTCEEAVQLWCGGYSRADGDGDGIPCETVCRSKSQVDSIKQKVGC
jgi:hypothetical protein